MTTLGLYGCKQAPGATTLALALAASLDEDDGAIVVEADPQGGDIAAMTGRPPTPGLLSLAAAGRNGSPVDMAGHVQMLPAGGAALVAPSDPLQVTAALAAIGDRLLTLASSGAHHVIVDRGRSDPGGAADVALLVCHPTLAGVEQARIRWEALTSLHTQVLLTITDDGPYRPDEVAAALSVPVLACIPRDPRGAAALAGRTSGRGLRRSPLLRTAATLADELRTRADATEPAW